MNIRIITMAVLIGFISWGTPLAICAENIVKNDTLGPNEKLGISEELRSNNGRYVFKLQQDGKLVVYDSQKKPLWSSDTYGSGAIECLMQDNGNLLLKNKRGNVVWSTHTDGNTNAKLVMQDDGNLVIYNKREFAVWAKGLVRNYLAGGENLLVHEFLRSQNAQHMLTLQQDGNLVAYDSQKKPLWSSDTYGSGAIECVMQNNGNLLLRDKHGKAVWSTDTHGYSNATLSIEDNGQVMLYKEKGHPFWVDGNIDANYKPDKLQTDAIVAYDPKTGDLVFDKSLYDLNYMATEDLDNFINQLSDTYNISKPWIENLVRTENVPPADVYMIVRTASVTHRSIDSVEQQYRAHRGQGWGVMAKNMGIKPGSEEFHALKKDEKEWLSKGKNKGHKKD